MRLVLATPLLPPDPGGPATYAKLLTEHLPEKDISVEVVYFGSVRSLPKLVRHVAYFWLLLKRMKHADLVLALDPVSVGFPAALAARFLKKPYLIKVVGDYAWEQGRQRYGITASLDEFVNTATHPPMVMLLNSIERWVAKRARHIIVPSAYLKRIVTAWGIPEANSTVVYNAVEYKAPGIVPKEVAALQAPRITYAGRLVPWKGVEGLIDAVHLLRSTTPEATLVVVGDGPEREKLELYARERLQKGYRFTGALPHDATMATIVASDVFVLNTQYEGLSHVLIETMALGVPIVTTPVGGNVELITDSVEGSLVPQGDAGAISDAIHRFLSDPKRTSEVTAAAKKKAEQFSVSAMIEHTQSVLRANI